MDKIRIPEWASFSVREETFYIIFHDRSDEVVKPWLAEYNIGFGPHNRSDINLGHSGCFCDVSVAEQIMQFSFPVISVLLHERGWKVNSSRSWELVPEDNYRPYYLSFDIRKMRFSLTQWGMGGMNIASWDYGTDEEKIVESVLYYCSHFAKKMPD